MIKAIIKLPNENIKYIDLLDWSAVKGPTDMFTRVHGMVGIAYPIFPEDGSEPTEYEMLYVAPENVVFIEHNAFDDDEEEETSK